MSKNMEKIKVSNKDGHIRKSILSSIIILTAGLIIGVLIKILDNHTSNLGNIFSQLSIWILLGTVIAIYSRSPKRAAVNVFLFCIGMLITYYLSAELTNSVYSRVFIYGWVAFSFCSPIFAYIVWYAKGRGRIANLLKFGILLTMLIISLLLFDRIRISDIIIAVITAVILFAKKPLLSKK